MISESVWGTGKEKADKNKTLSSIAQLMTLTNHKDIIMTLKQLLQKYNIQNDAVAVEYRVEFMIRWKVFIQEPQKFFSYIGRNVVAVGGVKPRDITFPVS